MGKLRKGEIIKDGRGRKMGQPRERGRGEGEGWFISLAHWKPVNQESISNLEICLGETGGGRNQRTARGEQEGGQKGSAVCMMQSGGGEQEQQKGEEAALSFIITVLIYSQPGRSAIHYLQLSMGVLW